MPALQLVGIWGVSLATAGLLVATRRWHGRWTGDFEDSGVQKHHKGSPPRIGLLPILVGILFAIAGSAYLAFPGDAELRALLSNVVLASLPVALLGLADDLTKKISPRVRLVGACVAGAMGMLLVGASVARLDLPVLGSYVLWAPFAVALTVLMVAGFSNAMNIVDGLNGLSSGLGLLMLLATAVAATASGDLLIASFCLVVAAALFGFFAINFPRGSIFLGDGAAYFLGFVLVQAWMLLLLRNPGISVWFVVALAAHPTMETLFSMYRRTLHRGRGGAFMAADRLHLHTLVYRRRSLAMLSRYTWFQPWMPNAAASVRVLAFGAMPMAAALVAPESAIWCLAVVVAYAFAYLAWFSSLVAFGRAHPRAGTALAAPEVASSSAQ